VTRFEDKTVVVTGAGHGIGRATALRFASEGANVAVVDIRSEEARIVADECASAGLSATAYAADVSDPDQVSELIATIVKDFGGIDILHSHAGRLRAGTVGETDIEEWNRTLSVNVTSMYLMVRAVVPVMQSRGGGAIVTTGSISGLFGEPALAVYTASKAAVVNLTRPHRYPSQLCLSRLGRYRIQQSAVRTRRPQRPRDCGVDRPHGPNGSPRSTGRDGRGRRVPGV
jgi:NAD(P)-dependent dehydrogenase (short-subunit alcohol dehydrogenase family)